MHFSALNNQITKQTSCRVFFSHYARVEGNCKVRWSLTFANLQNRNKSRLAWQSFKLAWIITKTWPTCTLTLMKDSFFPRNVQIRVSLEEFNHFDSIKIFKTHTHTYIQNRFKLLGPNRNSWLFRLHIIAKHAYHSLMFGSEQYAFCIPVCIYICKYIWLCWYICICLSVCFVSFYVCTLSM